MKSATVLLLTLLATPALTIAMQGDEQGVEAFYNFAVTPAFMITADLQVTDSAKEHTDTAVVGGLRATLRF